jgi:hypothetical protein
MRAFFLLLTSLTIVPHCATASDDPPAATRSLLKADSLDGWYLWASRANQKKTPQTVNWTIKNGIVTNSAVGRHLVTDKKFQDFELNFEFQLPPNCNSGIYLRGRYELKLKDVDPIQAKPEERCGAIFGQIAPSKNAFLGPSKWNKAKVILKGNEVTVVMNDKTIIDAHELKGPTHGAIDDQEAEPGPIMLNSHIKGKGIQYRNMTIRTLEN